MLRVFVYGDNHFFGDHLAEHLLQSAIAIQGGKIHADWLNALYPQRAKQSLGQASPRGKGQTQRKQHYGKAGHPSRSPGLRKKPIKERKAICSALMLGFETREGAMRVEVRRSGRLIQSRDLRAHAVCGDFRLMEARTAFRATGEMLLDLRAIGSVELAIVKGAQRILVWAVHTASSRPYMAT